MKITEIKPRRKRLSAVYIDGDIVVIVLTEEGLEKARSLLYF